MLPPGSHKPKASTGRKISRLTQGFSIRCLRFTSGVTATHARLASGWRAAPLPGGRRTLWTAAKGFRSIPHPPFQGLPCRKRDDPKYQRESPRSKNLQARPKTAFQRGHFQRAVPYYRACVWLGRQVPALAASVRSPQSTALRIQNLGIYDDQPAALLPSLISRTHTSSGQVHDTGISHVRSIPKSNFIAQNISKSSAQRRALQTLLFP